MLGKFAIPGTSLRPEKSECYTTFTKFQKLKEPVPQNESQNAFSDDQTDELDTETDPASEATSLISITPRASTSDTQVEIELHRKWTDEDLLNELD